MKPLFYILFFIITASITGCSPITPLTRAKKTPKIYTQNFCCDQEVKRTLGKRTPWIVFSDRDDNPTHYNPGGKVVLKKASYLEAFLVIGKKGEFLRVIKYAPDIIENNSLKNRKQIEYYGWIHQDNLLLSSQALTDIASGRTYKMITMIKNGNPLSQAENFLSKDSLILYKEPELLNPIKKIALHSLVYLYKKNNDRSKSLVFVKSQINPENTKNVISGWTSSSFITPYGTSFYSKLSEISIEKISLTDKSKKVIEQDSTFTFETGDTFTELNPITSLKQGGEMVDINTYVPINVIDNSHNYVYGISGNSITYGRFKKLKTDLKRINIVFAFENQSNVIANFEQLVVAINQLKNQLPNKKEYLYQIGIVVGFGMQNNTLLEFPLSKDVDLTLKELERLADSKKDIPLSNAQSWTATLRASQMLSKYSKENNLIITLGESGNEKEQIDKYLVENIIASNARVLGYQLFSDTGNKFNNFILQVQDIITRSSQEIIKQKKDFLVNSQQLRTENLFVERGENIYSLDFPKRSMWQGWIVFPKKKEQMSQDLLISSITSFIEEIQSDAQNMVNELQKSFVASGMSRSKINPAWMSLQNLPPQYVPNTAFAKPLAGTELYTLFPASVQIKKANWIGGTHFLLLSEEEINTVRDFLADITKRQVDYRYSNKKNERPEKKSFLEDDGTSTEEKTGENPEYFNTRKVRKSLQKSYYKWVRNNKLYPPKKRQTQKLTLTQATEQSIWFVSSNFDLQMIKVKDIRNKKKLSDKELDNLIEYFVKKKRSFEEAITTENQLKANGEIFYKISTDNLP